MNPIDPSRGISFSTQKYGGLQLDASASSTANSELGRIAQDVGSAIAKWQGNLHQALTAWLDDTEDMADLMNDLKQLIPLLESLKKDPFKTPLNAMILPLIVEYKMMGQDVSQLPIYIPADDYDKMREALIELGVPESEIPQYTDKETYNGVDYVSITIGQLQSSEETIKEGIHQGLGQVSAIQHDETMDMMKVMGSFNAVKMNEESLTNLMQTVASLSSSLEQNIQ